ncbi:hypothetical protein U1Q18_006397 [Sarracenia purpurea var. burkii]
MDDHVFSNHGNDAPRKNLSDEVALLSQVKESFSGVSIKNSKDNTNIVTPAKEIDKSTVREAGVEGRSNALEGLKSKNVRE